MTTISYLGPPFTFSEKAAQLLSAVSETDAQLVPESSMQAVARSLRASADSASDFAILPYYNYLEGLVQECLDLIYENELMIIGAQRVALSWSIGKYPDSTDEATVYSHPKALAQCSDYLWENYPKAVHHPTASTAEAGRVVGDTKTGLAIASAEAVRHFGLETFAEDIGNRRHGRQNFTDFYILGASGNCENDPSRTYSTMIAVTPYLDRPGLLADLLGQIASYGLNNAKIHSRPAIDHVAIDVEPQMFYLEIMCHQNEEQFQHCVAAIRERLRSPDSDVDVVRVLGSYPRPAVLATI